jgi:hypothetical protein
MNIVTTTKKKGAKEERRVVWGSIGPFCFIMQNGPIEPKATKSTLFFLFVFIHLLCLSLVARPLEAMHSITEMPEIGNICCFSPPMFS